MSAIFTKVKAAIFGAIILAIVALLDALGAIDLDALGLGPWAAPIGAAIAAVFAYVKKEVTGRYPPS